MRDYANCFLATLAGLAVTFQAAGDAAYLNVERQQWFSQVGLNPVPFFYQFTTLAVGAGFQTGGLTLQGPGATNTLTGTSVEMTFTTNVSALYLDGTNVINGADRFNSLYPAGTYHLNERMLVLGRYRTNIYPVALTNPFPVAPVITNLGFPPWLQATQTFQWPLFSSNPASHTVFYLLEGDLDTNILADFKAGGLASLTNLTLLARVTDLPATVTQYTVTNINPSADHLAVLEFYESGPTNTGTLPVKEAASVSANVILYLAPEVRIVSQPSSQSVPANSLVTFSVVAVGTPPLSYQWRFNGTPLAQATNALLVWWNVQTNRAGNYDVIVSNPMATVTSAVAVLTVTAPTNSAEPRLLYLRSPQLTSERHLRFAIDGQEEDVYAVQVTRDFLTWDVLSVITNTADPCVFTDPSSSTNPARFYRLEWLGNLAE